MQAVMARSGLKPDGHSGKLLTQILETLPREELFQSSVDELYQTCMGVLSLSERARTRLFVRRDRYGRSFSCLVYIPRDRFDSAVRERVEATLKRAFHGERVDSAIHMSESALARLHLVIRPKSGDTPDVDVRELETKIAAVVRNWHDELRDQLMQKHGEEKGIKLLNRCSGCGGRCGAYRPIANRKRLTPEFV
jgi:glutamate dehydrogenase